MNLIAILRWQVPANFEERANRPKLLSLRELVPFELYFSALHLAILLLGSICLTQMKHSACANNFASCLLNTDFIQSQQHA